jgi:hypothetical protein
MPIAVSCPQCQARFEAPTDAPPRHPAPRAPFPWSSLAILTIGLLFFLFVASAAFNVWYVVNPELRYDRVDRVRAMQEEAAMQRDIAQQNAEIARNEALRAQQNRETLKRENEELKRQLDIVRAQLDEAKRE